MHSWPVPHPTHVAPFVPHSLFDGVMQVLPLQQPVGHEVASQTHCPVVVLHSRPVGHAAHVAPPLPHEPFDSPEGASHVPPAVQQPLQVVPLHVHAPSVHACPEPQEPQAAPAVPHSVGVWDP